jgi:RNA polymerase sigma factor (sigma-70 family)
MADESNIPDGARSDEALIEAYRLIGDNKAIDILVLRHQVPLWNYARYLSWKKDKSFIDDIIGQIFLIILQGIKNNKFDPEKGTFKSWAYGICERICMAENRQNRRTEKPLSERYPEEFPETLIDLRTAPMEHDESSAELKAVLKKLLPEDRRLMLLKGGHSYEEIHQMPPYDQIELPELRQKVCRLRKYIIHLMEEMKHDTEPKQ